MKIAATISDYGAAANIGGPVENTTVIIDIPEEMVPKELRAVLIQRQKDKNAAHNIWNSLSFSLVVE